MKLNKLLTALCVATPIVGVACFTTSCQKPKTPEVEPTTETAETYIKDRTFAIATIDAQRKWTSGGAGTCWILADATPTNNLDYEYWIATNWHVKNVIPENKVGYWCQEVGGNTYAEFSSFTWNTNENEFCYTADTKTDAIDFYIAKANFGTADAIPDAVKTKLDKLNVMQEEKHYINKFLSSSSSDNWCHNNLHCGGYPGRKYGTSTVQEWHFSSLGSNATAFRYKGYKYMGSGVKPGHPIDSDDVKTAQIWDQSPNYEHQNGLYATWDSELGEYMSSSWSLSAGASGSMLITAHNGEWCVVGIYWGIWELQLAKYVDAYIFPAFSLFKTPSKNFVDNYELKTK